MMRMTFLSHQIEIYSWLFINIINCIVISNIPNIKKNIFIKKKFSEYIYYFIRYLYSFLILLNNVLRAVLMS